MDMFSHGLRVPTCYLIGRLNLICFAASFWLLQWSGFDVSSARFHRFFSGRAMPKYNFFGMFHRAQVLANPGALPQLPAAVEPVPEPTSAPAVAHAVPGAVAGSIAGVGLRPPPTREVGTVVPSPAFVQDEFSAMEFATAIPRQTPRSGGGCPLRSCVGVLGGVKGEKKLLLQCKLHSCLRRFTQRHCERSGLRQHFGDQ